MCSLFKEVANVNPSHLLIAGDFNYNDINWSLLNNPIALHQDSQHFIETIRECFLYQHVSEPTRSREGSIPSCLDLLFTNEEAMINGLSYLPGLGNSDHLCLRFKFNCYSVSNKISVPRWNLNKGDHDEIRCCLQNVNWADVMKDLSVEDSWKYFVDTLYYLFDKHIPKIKCLNKKNIYTTQEFQIKEKKVNALEKLLYYQGSFGLCKISTG